MILAPLEDEVLSRQLGGLAPDSLLSFTLGSPDGPKGGELRGVLIHASRLVNRMRVNHGLGPFETLVLGQAYVAAGLLASTLKGGDSLGLRLDCDGPVEGWSVGASAEGGFAVRGYLFRDVIPLLEAPESLDIPPYVGKGSLTMTRFSEGGGQPFTSTVSIKTGRLAEDLAGYFLQSEQTPTAFALGLHFDREGRMLGAGGMYLQALPGATTSLVERAEALLGGLAPIGRHFAEGGRGDSLLSLAFATLGLVLRGEAPVDFRCGCSRDRFASFMAKAEGNLLEDLVGKGPWPVEAVCHQCGSKYHWERQELSALLEERNGGATPAP